MATSSKVKGLSVFLKAKRIEAGFTQMQAAEALGHSSAQYISNFERGLCEPSIESAAKLCEAYKVSKRELYEEMVGLYQEALSEKLLNKRTKPRKVSSK